MGESYFTKLAKRMHNGYFIEKKVSDELEEQVPIPNRKKGKKRPILGTTEKIDIVHQAIVQLLPWKDIAKEHRVSVSSVSNLVTKAKKNPEFIEEVYEK